RRSVLPWDSLLNQPGGFVRSAASSFSIADMASLRIERLNRQAHRKSVNLDSLESTYLYGQFRSAHGTTSRRAAGDQARYALCLCQPPPITVGQPSRQPRAALPGGGCRGPT